jgi:uncharacterized membrane protein YdjX (TVP38/TMEM64 family)
MMSLKNESGASAVEGARKLSLRRLAPLIVIACISIVVLAMGWQRQISFESLVRHHDTLRSFIAAHQAAALAGYVAVYIAIAGLSLPAGAYLTVIGGILFGTLLGGIAAIIGASIGAIVIFCIAKSALGEHLVRKAGPTAAKVARGFRENAFYYLLFLRLVPVFPFWLVNLVSAICGLRLATFAAGTVIGIMPATFVFASVGSGLTSVMTAQEGAYTACVASGRTDCRLAFHAADALTPQLFAALVALGLLALVPVLVQRWRGRRCARSTRPGHENA